MMLLLTSAHYRLIPNVSFRSFKCTMNRYIFNIQPFHQFCLLKLHFLLFFFSLFSGIGDNLIYFSLSFKKPTYFASVHHVKFFFCLFSSFKNWLNANQFVNQYIFYSTLFLSFFFFSFSVGLRYQEILTWYVVLLGSCSCSLVHTLTI